MSATEIKEIRKEVKKYIDLADDKTVKMIYAMLEVEHMEDAWTDKAFIEEMDRRTKEYESGSAKLFSLEEMVCNEYWLTLRSSVLNQNRDTTKQW